MIKRQITTEQAEKIRNLMKRVAAADRMIKQAHSSQRDALNHEEVWQRWCSR